MCDIVITTQLNKAIFQKYFWIVESQLNRLKQQLNYSEKYANGITFILKIKKK